MHNKAQHLLNSLTYRLSGVWLDCARLHSATDEVKLPHGVVFCQRKPGSWSEIGPPGAGGPSLSRIYLDNAPPFWGDSLQTAVMLDRRAQLRR